jgi:hypothetical protein
MEHHLVALAKIRHTQTIHMKDLMHRVVVRADRREPLLLIRLDAAKFIDPLKIGFTVRFEFA